MLKTKNIKIQGITLIEMIIYASLISLLMVNMINYLYSYNQENIKLMNEVEDSQKGFIATVAVILLATGTLAFTLVTLGSVASYADMVGQREMRIQKSLNLKACDETLPIISAKDYFLDEEIYLSDLGCKIHK
jgi:amino acid transporter